MLIQYGSLIQTTNLTRDIYKVFPGLQNISFLIFILQVSKFVYARLLFICLFIYLFIYLFICLLIYLFIYLFIFYKWMVSNWYLLKHFLMLFSDKQMFFFSILQLCSANNFACVSISFNDHSDDNGYCNMVDRQKYIKTYF